MSEVFIPKIENAGSDDITRFQELKLQDLLNYLQLRSPFYKKFFARHKIDISRIKILADLRQIPTTDKENLQESNMDFLCVEPGKIIDYITTSGTLGSPITFAVTENDLERLAYNEFLSFTTAGGTPSDIYQLMVTMDRRFMAGLAYFLGIRKLGAAAVRVGPGNPELQIDSFKRFKPTSLVTVPSFLLKLIEYAGENGFDLNQSSVKSAVCIGEPLRNGGFELNTLGKQIVENWNIQLFSTYASTEMGAAFTECQYGCGGHHHPELLIVEFLDENENPVKPGEPGELTFTTLGVEGMPLLRFKSGDICTHYTEPCRCGRSTLRLGSLIGRKKQMIKYKGTTIYPPALYDILNDIKGVENYIVEVFSNEIDTDEILIRVGTHLKNPEFEKTIKDHFRAKLRVAPRIEFSDPLLLERLQHSQSSRKPAIFFDRRKNRL
jgi:phenylacetate-CoA ligase